VVDLRSTFGFGGQREILPQDIAPPFIEDSRGVPSSLACAAMPRRDNAGVQRADSGIVDISMA